MSEETGRKSDGLQASEIPRPSAAAAERLRRAMPAVLAVVSERLAVESAYAGTATSPAPTPEHLAFARGVQSHFGATLSAIYDLGLFESLPEEAAWYVSTLAWRGLGPDAIRRMIEAWSVAIYSSIKPPEADQLVAPLKWIKLNVERLREREQTGDGRRTQELGALLALVLGKRRRDAADYLLDLARKGRSLADIHSGLIGPALTEIGLMWQQHKISAADEHAATEICRYSLFRLLDSMPRHPELHHTALVTAVPGEEHAFGAEILAGYLDLQGWQTVFLGRSAPAEDIVEAARSTGSEVVFLSVALTANLPQAVALAGALRILPSSPRVIMGGRAAAAAAGALGRYADAVATGLEDAHARALGMVTGDA